MTVGDDRIESTKDPIAIGIRNDQGGQKLDGMTGMTGMTGDLTENFMLLEQGHGNELAEQPLSRRFERPPRSPQF